VRGGVVEGMYDSVLKRKKGEVNADKIGARACSARQHAGMRRRVQAIKSRFSKGETVCGHKHSTVQCSIHMHTHT
jgi:hypothetical protein